MLAERALDIFACIALDEFKVCVSDSIRGRARFLDGELFRADGFQRDKFVNRNVIQPRQNDKIVEPWQSFTVGLRSIAARRLAQNAPLEHFAGFQPSLPKFSMTRVISNIRQSPESTAAQGYTP